MGAGPEDVVKRLEAKFRAGSAVVGIAGLGCVGSEMARAASARFPVRGYDLDAVRARAATSTSGKGIKASGEPSILQGAEDRKSTRLNSSHGHISYAVLC